jgi:lipopolysaccharide transport system permease protein
MSENTGHGMLDIPPALLHVHIEPSHGWVALNLGDLWRYRELLYFLVWRDIKVRYKQTLLGAAWAILQPFLTMVVFSVFFGRLAQMPSDGLPYPLFSYAGLLPWQLFAFALSESSNSLVANQRLITKVYFPRLVIPIAAVLAGIVDFAIAFVVLLGMMVYYGVYPSLAVLVLPLLLALALATALAVGLWLSAFNVQYRDVRYVIPFLTQFWLFLTPIAYPSSLVPEWLRPIYALNPMVGVVEGFRWALLGTQVDVSGLVLVSTLVVLLLIFGGLMYFRRMEKVFADLV